MFGKEIIFSLRRCALIFAAFSLLVACGGSGSKESTTDDSGEKYLTPLKLSGYFNNVKSETQTIQEFTDIQEKKLKEIESSKLITEITRGNYDASSGYASFSLEFSYAKNEYLQGPSYTIYSYRGSYSSGAFTSYCSGQLNLATS
jgi:hypothetical protein